MGTNDPLEPEDLLSHVQKYLVSVPEATRILKEACPDEAWYAVKVRRLVQAGDLPAARVGGEHSEGYYLIDRRELDSLVADRKKAAEEDGGEGEGEEA